MTKIILATIPTGGTVSFEMDIAAAEPALEEEERKRLARDPAAEARRKPPPQTPTRTLVGLLGARASGFFGG